MNRRGLSYLFGVYIEHKDNATTMPPFFWKDVQRLYTLAGIKVTENACRKRFRRMYKNSTNTIAADLDSLDRKIFKHIENLDLKYFQHVNPPSKTSDYKVDKREKIVDIVDDNNKRTIDSKSTRIKTEQDLIDACNIDMTFWERDRIVFNKWEVGAKDSEGNIVVEPLYQIKLWLKPRNEAILTQQYVDTILSRLEGRSPHIPKFSRPYKEEYFYEIGIPDLHFGKLGWDKEVGHDYNIEITRDLFLNAIDDLLEKVSHVKGIGKILLPIGNDLFHVDNFNNQTTKGTPLDADTRWQKSFDMGIDMIIEGIEKCKKVAGVDVIMVPGNHDYQRTHYAGSTLRAWYRNDENVTIDNTPRTRKAYKNGNVFIMYTHGNEEKVNQLPLIMFTEFKDSSACDFREIHIGHIHTRKNIDYTTTEEFNGVRVSVLPSLCPPDAWHYKKGYVQNIRSAEGRLYSLTHGNCGIFPTNVV